jgi:probable phosphoglycerate mutase
MPRTRRSRPSTTLVLFVRHGQTPTTGDRLPGRARGLHLSDAGRAQAEAVGARIAGLSKVDAVYSSPLERTRETAACIARARGAKVKIERGLLECDYGDWTGGELKALVKTPEWRTIQRFPSGFRFPNGESFPEMQMRMLGAVERIRRAHPGGTVVAVSHADPIKAATAAALGTHLDLFQRIVISTCSVTAIAYADAGTVVLTVNNVGELEGLKPS